MKKLSRIAAAVEYGGENYCGWQSQKNGVAVQDEVERALSKVANAPIQITAAGRTDSGVHALAQIIHFDYGGARSENEWLRGVNTHLPDDISLLWTQIVGEDFNARFTATARHYRYIILNRRAAPALLHRKITWHHQKLDAAAMQTAGMALIGRHDFSAFRAANCQANSPIKEVRELQVSQHGEWIWLDICADGFLYHMVRNIVGALFRIGSGSESVEWLGELLANKDRAHLGITAPADGLYLTAVDYPSQYNLPPAPPLCKFW